MGLYDVTCAKCSKHFMWFSGNTSAAGQICPECQNPKKETPMNNQEQQLVEALQGTIKVQEAFINYLKAEVERLKASQINLSPTPIGTLPYVQPIIYPTNPGPVTVPSFPPNPWNPCPPFIVTSETTPNSGTITVASDGTLSIPPEVAANFTNNNIVSLSNSILSDADSKYNYLVESNGI